MMIRAFTAVALSLAATTASLAADADEPPVAPPRGGVPSFAPILKKITPAVVNIETRGHMRPDPKSSRRARREVNSVGSGVVYDAQRGLIVTNDHVLKHATDIMVTLTDGRMLKAKRVGGDPDFDLAVISVPAERLTAIPFGDSRQLEVGDFVLAIGYPANVGQTVTSGIVSGLHRSNIGIEEFENFIQTDAAMYPGNSGGALVNVRGDLVGINTAFIRATAGNPGVGFAIPVNMAHIIMDQIVEIGEIRRGSFGITFDDPTPDVMRELKISAPQGCAVIVEVDPRSPGARAGLKSGDIVTEIGGRPVRDSTFLRTRLALLLVGDVAEFAVLRDGKPLKIRATVAERDQNGPRESDAASAFIGLNSGPAPVPGLARGQEPGQQRATVPHLRRSIWRRSERTSLPSRAPAGSVPR
jgi:serine protease Do/serine protease DegQ